MTLKQYISSHRDIEEFTVFDNDYDIETYFYHPDMTEKWDRAMNDIADKLLVTEYEHDKVTVNLSEVLERNLSNGAFGKLFINNDIDDIMDDIMNIFAGYVSDSWLTEFADSLT